MSNPCKLTSELLPLIAAAFPCTFFTEPSQVRPLKEVFERQPKAPAEAASPLAEALSATLAAVSPVEVAPASAVPAINPTTADPAGQRSTLSLKKRNLPC